MSDPFLGEVRMFGFNFPPRGWAACNGQLMPINQNQALFSLLGTTYGGNGQVTFGLPDLRGRVPFHFGGGFVQGQTGGEENHTLITAEMPSHTHSVSANANSANQSSPASGYSANSGRGLFAPTSTGTMAPAAVGNAGSNQPHSNLSPFLVVNFCIAVQGIFPSRN